MLLIYSITLKIIYLDPKYIKTAILESDFPVFDEPELSE